MDTPPTTPHKLGQALRAWQWGLGVSLLGLVGSILLAHQQFNGAHQIEQARFVQSANAATDAVVRRIDAYTEIAYGLRSLFIVNPELSRRAFVDAASHLDLEARYPGVKNIAFTRYVSAAEKKQFESRVRADTSVEPQGYPGFAIHPGGERKEYFVADYLWPTTGNKGIHGLDISAQPANLASMQYSQRSRQPVASAPFNLIQETTHRTGFVIRVPVFRTPVDGAAQSGNASDFLGSVAVTLRVFDLFQQLEREGYLQGLQITLADRGSTLTPPSGDIHLPMYATPPGATVFDNEHRRNLGIDGRTWQLDFRPNRSFLSDAERRAPLLMGAAGGVISLLLGALVYLLALGRVSALEREAAKGVELQSSEERWKFAIEGSGDGLWDWDVAKGSVFFSTHWKEMVGFTQDGIGESLDEWSGRIHPDEKKQVMSALQSYLDGGTPQFANEHRMMCRDGSWKWVLVRAVVVNRDAAGKPTRVIGTQKDITDRKAIEDAIQQSQIFLDSIIECSPSALWISDAHGTLIRMNQSLRDHLHLQDHEVVGKYNVLKDNLIASQGYMPQVQAVFDHGIATRFVTSYDTGAVQGLTLNETTHVDLDVSISPIVDAHGKVTNAIIQHLDISERVRAEKALQASLQEKEALLKELHHRVKNNLQIVASLLRLESRRSAVPEAINVLKAMQGRIQAMAQLHQSLYRSGTFASVDLGAYLGQIATQAFQAQQVPGNLAQLQLDLGTVSVGMDQAIACGLLVNELISNALKHGFPDGRSGAVRVELQPVDPATVQTDALWRLRVHDTGVGLPPDFEERRTTSLGLQLVGDLGQQAGGTLTIVSQAGVGTEFSLVFKALAPATLVMPA